MDWLTVFPALPKVKDRFDLPNGNYPVAMIKWSNHPLLLVKSLPQTLFPKWPRQKMRSINENVGPDW